MRVLFATVAALRQGPYGPTSDLASARYRVIIPAQQLARLGHQAQIASLDDAGGAWPDNVKQAQCDVLVISKSFHAANEQLPASMRGRRVRGIADICNDYFADPKHGAPLPKLTPPAAPVV